MSWIRPAQQCLFVGGSHDGERLQIPDDLQRVALRGPMQQGENVLREEIYDAHLFASGERRWRIFAFNLTAQEVMQRLIDCYRVTANLGSGSSIIVQFAINRKFVFEPLPKFESKQFKFESRGCKWMKVDTLARY